MPGLFLCLVAVFGLLSPRSVWALSEVRRAEITAQLSLEPVFRIVSVCHRALVPGPAGLAYPDPMIFPLGFDQVNNSQETVILKQQAVPVEAFAPEIRQMFDRIMAISGDGKESATIEAGFVAIWTRTRGVVISRAFTSFHMTRIFGSEIAPVFDSALAAVDPSEVIRVQRFHTHPPDFSAWHASEKDIDSMIFVRELLARKGIRCPIDEHILIPGFTTLPFQPFVSRFIGSPRVPFVFRVTLEP